MDREFFPRNPRTGFLSHLTDRNLSAMSDSTGSSHRPHKQSSFVRRLSQRRQGKAKAQPPPAYLSRQSSKINRNRPLSSSSTVPRTSMESQMSSRAYKLRKLDVFSPHPTLHLDDGGSPTSTLSSEFGCSGLAPSRSDSRRTNSRTAQTWRYKGPSIYEDDRHARVDDLVDELDAKGLREAMEREQRRRYRKKAEYEERLRMKLEKKATTPHRDVERGGGASGGMDRDVDEQQVKTPDAPGGSPVSNGDGTPLSWFNADPSTEDMGRGMEQQQFTPRPDVVTPVSMESRESRDRLPSPPPPQPQVEKAPPVAVADQAPTGRTKTSAWASFIKRATAARVKKERSSRSPPVEQQPPAVSDTEGGEEYVNKQTEPPSRNFLDVEDLRQRQGQTPGRHIPKEIVLAMNAVETGHIQDRGYLGKGYPGNNDDYEDEMRDAVLSTPQIAPYNHHSGSQSSSRSSLSPHGLGLRGGNKSHSPVLGEETKDSPTIPAYHPRPHSAQRYSPSFHRSGGVSPENGGPRSVMSTSLASIDSEGSWLSGKLGPRTSSVQQLSPLRTSASSLRKRYQELDGDDVVMDDDGYFTGVAKGAKETRGDDDDDDDDDQDIVGGAVLDLDDTDDDDDGSINSEDERNMWREGDKKRVQVQSPFRTLSREGTVFIEDGDSPKEAMTPVDETPGENDTFATPLEDPDPRRQQSPKSTKSVYQTPMEQPARRGSYFGPSAR